ncbi:hypothetical protein SBOR_6493 [Sclerotinia borealis F-4128]|uniref:Protein kinase domain-containing protein n=1 Tax=Sclerotinia borealis (strain F-4128) TaxID=1432307 RepID=W9CB91_SCLBF|nr:hypothetical protein SBOR_6493 [Sclerotinia borealis F-4128]
MVSQRGWIADRLRSGHEFKIGDDIWMLSGSPIKESQYTYFSRAVFECKIVHKREGIPSHAIVKIWMQTQKIAPLDPRHRRNSHDSGDSSHGSDSPPSNSDSPPLGSDPDAGSNSDFVFKQDWDRELECLNIMKKGYDEMKAAAVKEKVELLSKPFPHAIGLAVEKQEQNFPVQGGYLVYLVMEKLPGDCITEYEFWQWTKSERDDFRRAFEQSAQLIEKLGVENIDKAMRNLLWDKQNNKCYLIDWENWTTCNPDDPYPLPDLQCQYDMIRDLGPRMGQDRWDTD